MLYKPRYIKESIILIKNNWFDFLFLLFQLIYFSRNIRYFNTDLFLGINLLIVIFLCIIKKRFFIKRSFFYLTGIYLFVVFFSGISFGFGVFTILGYYVRLLTAYFLIFYFEKTFYLYFETSIFILALISIPLYILQMAFPSVFDIFLPFSMLVLDPTVLDLADFRYALIFLINNWNEGAISYRNSGFMSEPSAYAAVLAWASIANLGLYRFRINFKLVVIIIALISTVSLGGYIYLALLLMGLFISNVKSYKNISYLVLLITFVGLSVIMLKDKDVYVKNKVEFEYKITDQDRNWDRIERGIANPTEVSRISGARIAIRDFLRFPFGYGFDYKENYYSGSSPNGLASLLYIFGVSFIIIILISSIRLTRIIMMCYKGNSIIQSLVIMGLLIIPIAGYSFTNQPFLWLLILFPLIVDSRVLYYQFLDKN